MRLLPNADNVYRDVAEALGKVLADAGAEVLTDYHRAQIGLSPRGPDGWTTEEIIELERKRLEAISRPLTFTIPSFDDIRKQSGNDPSPA